jgi:catechol 2,3-dioxygenase-like lactoylglutathione lyase family enzyme
MANRVVHLTVSLCVLASLATPALRAQLAAPGEAAVVMGHLHLAVRDLDVHRAFWATLGGTPVQNGTLQLIQFPGTFVMLRRAEPTGGTVGSVVNHVGFLVKNLQEWKGKAQAAGWKTEPGTTATQFYILSPDDVRIEMTEDRSIATPIKMHHIHFNTPAVLEMQAWYAKTLGAMPGKRGPFDAADLPGVNLTFTKVESALAGTKGRSLDHIGFEVKNLEEFCKKLEAGGVKLDRPYTKLPNSATAIAFLTDPWGTYIELTENLAPPMGA